MTTRFTRPGSEAELLNSQAAWLADTLAAAADPAAVSASQTIRESAAGRVELPAFAFAECAAMLKLLASDGVSRQPQPQELWRLDRLRRLLALELDLRDSESGS